MNSSKEARSDSLSGLRILYQDDYLCAVHKPSGLLVHRTSIAPDRITSTEILQDHFKRKMAPIHRLDRGTSGVILFAFHINAARSLSLDFENRRVKKIYQAIVRGYFPQSLTVDYALREDEESQRQEAITHFEKIKQIELPYPVGRYPTARYSWLEAQPLTGRMHQIRKHLAHVSHPILGDTTYGDSKHNHFLRDQLQANRMMLHALSLRFTHPETKRQMEIRSQNCPQFHGFIEKYFQNSSSGSNDAPSDGKAV